MRSSFGIPRCLAEKEVSEMNGSGVGFLFAGAWLHAVKAVTASATMPILNDEFLDFILSFLFDTNRTMSG